MLETQPDEVLRAVMAGSKQLLAARASERRKQALAQIRQIAKENDLSVSVKEQARKRGRPRKDSGQT